jgi:peptidoglycan/LPS O-acetylase OafA/YrhL
LHTPEAGTSRHLPALDGLRGTAVLGVVAYHAGHLTGGYLGVDLFFVLSGFLITRLLLDEKARTGAIDLKHFWSRRARRLLPAVLLVIAVIALYSAFFAKAPELATLRADAVSTLLYVANWNTILANHSYWAQFSAPSPLQHTWSLAIEEQFYVLWPLVCIAVLGRRRPATDVDADNDPNDAGTVDAATGEAPAVTSPDRGARRLMILSLTGAAVSAAIMIRGYAPDIETTRLYVGTDTRVAAILLGAALSCAMVVYGPVRGGPTRRVLEAAGWIATLGLALAWVRLDGHAALLYQGGLFACGLGVVIVITAVTHPTGGMLTRLFSLAPLRFAGRISYGLYLWHWPIFTWLTAERTGWSEPVLLPVQLALTLAVSLLSYQLIEMPIRRGAIPSTVATRAAPAVLVLVLVAVIVATIPPATEESADPAAYPITALTPVGARGNAPPRVLIVGDSVGDSITRSIVPEEARFGVDLESMAVPGCSFVRTNPAIHYLDGAVGDETACLERQRAWVARIDEWHPDVIISIYGWAGNTERQVDGEWRRPCDTGFDQWYAGEVAAALDALQHDGAAVFLTSVPYMRSAKAPADSDRSTDCLNQIYRSEAATRHVGVVDLAEYVCPHGACRDEQGGITLRPDGLHFEGVSGLWAGDWVLQQAWTAMRGDPPERR